MQVLPDKTGSNSDIISPVKEKNVRGNLDGWNEVETKETYSNQRLIQIANQKISLQTVFEKYNINFENKYSAAGWNQVCKCPFKDHFDQFPSFGYNKTLNSFNCFGCNRGGGPVHFIAYMEGISSIVVAKKIIGEIFYDDDYEPEDGINYKELEQLLFDYADYVRLFKEKYNYIDLAINYVEAVTWSLDIYLKKNIGSGTIDINSLKNRILKLKEQLEVFNLESG